jgi:hypothetical protein
MSNPLPQFTAQLFDDCASDISNPDYRSGKAGRLYRETSDEAEAVYDNDFDSHLFDSHLDPAPGWLGGLFLAVAFAAGWAGCYLCMTLVGGH